MVHAWRRRGRRCCDRIAARRRCHRAKTFFVVRYRSTPERRLYSLFGPSARGTQWRPWRTQRVIDHYWTLSSFHSFYRRSPRPAVNPFINTTRFYSWSLVSHVIGKDYRCIAPLSIFHNGRARARACRRELSPPRPFRPLSVFPSPTSAFTAV